VLVLKLITDKERSPVWGTRKRWRGGSVVRVRAIWLVGMEMAGGDGEGSGKEGRWIVF